MCSRRKSSGNLPSREIKRKERLITKIMTCKYEKKISGEIMSRNYYRKLSGEIMTQNYDLLYNVAKNVGIIGILVYPKRYRSKSLRENNV